MKFFQNYTTDSFRNFSKENAGHFISKSFKNFFKFFSSGSFGNSSKDWTWRNSSGQCFINCYAVYHKRAFLMVRVLSARCDRCRVNELRLQANSFQQNMHLKEINLVVVITKILRSAPFCKIWVILCEQPLDNIFLFELFLDFFKNIQMVYTVIVYDKINVLFEDDKMHLKKCGIFWIFQL